MKLTKKSTKIFLITIIITTLAISGCTGGSDQPENSDNQEKDLKMNEFSFATNIKGQDNYEDHDDQYSPEDTIHFYFEAKGFKKDDGNVDIKQDLEVEGPEGKTVLNRNIVNQTLDMSGTEIAWFQNKVTPPENGFKTGEYKIRIILKDKKAENTLNYVKSFTVKESEETNQEQQQNSELKIKNFSYAEKISENGDYESHPKYHNYNETVLMYLEVHGLKVENNEVDLTQSHEVIGSENEVIESGTVLNTTVPNMQEGGYIWIKDFVEPPENGFKKGKHIIKFTVTDKKTKNKATLQKEFIIE